MTLFKLLQQGCEIKFPSGYMIKGDPVTGYIDCLIEIGGERMPDGLRPLDKIGTRDALSDARKYFEDQQKENQ